MPPKARIPLFADFLFAASAEGFAKMANNQRSFHQILDGVYLSQNKIFMPMSGFLQGNLLKY